MSHDKFQEHFATGVPPLTTDFTGAPLVYGAYYVVFTTENGHDIDQDTGELVIWSEEFNAFVDTYGEVTDIGLQYIVDEVAFPVSI